MPSFIVGTFAPVITPELLSTYRTIVEEQAPKEIRQELLNLCQMMEVFQETPESQEPKEPHPTNTGFVQRLSEAEIRRIDSFVPWDWEIKALARQCRDLPPKSATRKAAYHLLWYARELTLDREPCTRNKLS